MSNPTQYERYQLLLEYLDKHFKNKILTKQIESVCFYSYRNINRIFHSLNNETIGQYIKRLRIEKAAEYLKYSKTPVANIAGNLGFSDSASFSKAFKKIIGASPKHYRDTVNIENDMLLQSNLDEENQDVIPIEYQIVHRPEMLVFYRQYQGSYENSEAMLDLWEHLIKNAIKSELLVPATVYLGEILDDDEIASSLRCRYNAAFSIKEGLEASQGEKFSRKIIPGGAYVKFIHWGSHKSTADTYAKIYSQWMRHIGLELADKATLEIYLDSSTTSSENLPFTEIYVPVVLNDA